MDLINIFALAVALALAFSCPDEDSFHRYINTLEARDSGGLIDEAEGVANELLAGGVIYSTRHRGRDHVPQPRGRDRADQRRGLEGVLGALPHGSQGCVGDGGARPARAQRRAHRGALGRGSPSPTALQKLARARAD